MRESVPTLVRESVLVPTPAGIPSRASQADGGTAASARGARPYRIAWNLLPLLAGIIDPFLGVLGKFAAIFWNPELPDRADSPRRRRRGLTIVLGGIEGPSFYNYSMGVGLLRGGYRGAVVRFAWNAGLFGVRSWTNLVNRRHHERQSDILAELIVDQAHRHPTADIALLAQSGGCWIVLRALEKLPADVTVSVAVLLAAAVSPGRDISLAASKCRRGLISIGSLGDFFFLGLGTLLLGTSDRVFTPAAGFVGWHCHPPAFVEARWHPTWARWGYWGNHTLTSAPRFVQCVIAPLLKQGGHRD